MSLREEVAETLYCAFYSTRPRPKLEVDLIMAAHKDFDPYDPTDASWLAMADECIRQMEFARRNCYIIMRSDHAELGDELKLAPGGWKP